MIRNWIFATLMLSLFISHAQVGNAQLSASEEATAKAVFFEVLSPFCPGRSLNDCPSESANNLKDEIRQMVKQGQQKEQIVDTLLARFGEEFRAVPAASGFGGLAWAGPIVFLLVGGIVVALWLMKNSSPEESSSQKLNISDNQK